MRIKPILQYHITTTKSSLVIFYSIYLLGTLIGAITSFIARRAVVGVNVTTGSEGATQSWSLSIIGFVIYMIVVALILAQQETQFLITRAASRKEIFISNTIFLAIIAAALSALQIISIVLDGLARKILGTEKRFRGLELDIQILQAPNMKNILIFLVVNFSIILVFGALSYLLGSCLARNKMITVGVILIGGVLFIACLAFPEFIRWLVDTFKYMLTDEKTGLLIALKQTVFAAVILLLSFPVMRRITATKQSQ